MAQLIKNLIKITIQPTAIFKSQVGAIMLKDTCVFTSKYCGCAAQLSWPTHHILQTLKKNL